MLNVTRRARSSLIITLLLLVTAWPHSRGLSQQPVQPANPRVPRRVEQSPVRPKLVVAIVIDQFRYDFLERFGDLFGPGGFRRLINGGALFTNAHFNYVPTYTAPGHASIFTGSVPAQNGIVGNTWYDRETGRTRVMVSDLAARMVTDEGVTGEPGLASPRIMIGTTIGDQMRLSNNFQSKVIAVSFKDRSAVLPGGHRPNGAFWFNSRSGRFISSDYYSKELPGWVKKFNTAHRPDKYFGMKWDRALKADAYKNARPDNKGVFSPALGKSFPYLVTGGAEGPTSRFYSTFELTPFASEYLGELAKAALDAELLGSDEFPDLLSVSFSSTDLLGHAYGPDSQEVMDSFVRLDRVVAELLTHIDRKVGLHNTIIAMTGDHGVAPVPEQMQEAGYDAARIASRDVAEAVNRGLSARFGEGNWVLSFVNDQLYLDQKLISERKLEHDAVERAAGNLALSVPGVVDFFTRSQLVNGCMPATRIGRLVQNGFNRRRSGDVWLILKPFAFVSEGTLGTTHGSPYSYDTHVPVILFGRGVRPGRYHVESSPGDIAPTLAVLLRVEPPSNWVGRVLPAVVD